MQNNQIFFLLFLFFLLICLITQIKKRPSALLSFLGRSASGLTFLHFFNLFCSVKGIVTYVAVNPLTACISAFLGIPGVLLMYAMRLWGLR